MWTTRHSAFLVTTKRVFGQDRDRLFRLCCRQHFVLVLLIKLDKDETKDRLMYMVGIKYQFLARKMRLGVGVLIAERFCLFV